jgi:hypothetical protein
MPRLCLWPAKSDLFDRGIPNSKATDYTDLGDQDRRRGNGISGYNDQILETFVRWYPGMQTEQETEIQKKAA